MRWLCFAIFTLTTSSAVAQNAAPPSANRAMENALKQLGQRGTAWKASPLALASNQVVLSGKSDGVCSVPLLEVPISSDPRNFTMKIIKPDTNTAAMPQASVPAPPCMPE